LSEKQNTRKKCYFLCLLGTVLFAVTGGTETPIRKVYMIDAGTGDILTSFDSNPVNLFLIKQKKIVFPKKKNTRKKCYFLCLLGTVLFAVTGGTETPIKKVYMIDARTGDILTSFDSNPVNNNFNLKPNYFFL